MLTLDPKTTSIPLIVCSAAIIVRGASQALLAAIRDTLATRKSADRM